MSPKVSTATKVAKAASSKSAATAKPVKKEEGVADIDAVGEAGGVDEGGPSAVSEAADIADTGDVDEAAEAAETDEADEAEETDETEDKAGPAEFVFTAEPADTLAEAVDELVALLDQTTVAAKRVKKLAATAAKKKGKRAGPKRPPSEYNVFVGKTIKELREAEPELASTDRFRKAVTMWKALPK